MQGVIFLKMMVQWYSYVNIHLYLKDKGRDIMDFLEIIIAILIVVNIIITLMNSGKKDNNKEVEKSLAKLEQKIIEVDKSMEKLERSFREEALSNREENRTSEKAARFELTHSLERALKSFEEQFSKSVREFNVLQREKFNDMALKQGELIKATEDKLEKMRETVDEKLQSTLEKRLGESFKLVSDRLEVVHKGLGEMQTLAMGVGDLKKVLSNVKTRGTLGEIQLGRILEQILTREQYDENVVTKPGSRDNVEFAIRLPGKEDSSEIVYLPIDSKFPLDVYHNLVDAYEDGDGRAVDEGLKKLETAIKKCAKDIRDKYIDPPHTTDFAIMFLPIEGLYAEVVKRTNLMEILQREYRINITGPTTLAALLNSLQMGFRTLAIEKRSSEVWKVLGAVKTEFSKFEDVLKATQKKLNQASTDLDKLVGTRTKQINKKLESVESLKEDSKDINDMLPVEEEDYLDTND